VSDDPRVEQLLDELCDSHATPEDVCGSCPELLPVVRERLRQLRRVEAEVDALFAGPPVLGAGGPPSAHDAMALPRVPGYEVEAVLGRGGMGVVYKARHPRLNRAVALKMLLAGPYAGPGELERFLREAETVAGLRHANIVQVHEAGDVDGRPYFTMEFVEGGSLAQQLVSTPQPARQAAALVAAVAEAVHAAHQRGIVHRDLKPGNILLTADGTPKLTDFGLARRLEDAAGLTQSGAPLGTPSYMAPEQAEGRSREVGPAADTYALGAILYELLTGRPPFRAETAAETLRQVVSQEPVPPSRLNAAVPRDLETICLKCLEKDPQRRYASAAALAEDLHRFQRNEPIRARPVGPLERVLRWARRRPSAAALAATALALVGLALGGGVWFVEQRAARRAELRSEVGTAVAQAASLRKRLHFREARELLEQARQLLEPAGPDDLRRQVDQARADLKLVENLDTARLRMAIPMKWSSVLAEAELLYEQALAKAGLSRPGDDSEVKAARVRDSAVCEEIVAALDDWASKTEDPARQARLLAVAREADPHPSRNRLRDPQWWQGGPQLTRLVRELRVEEVSPHLWAALGQVLLRTGRDGVPLLRAAQAHYPQDFWLTYELGWTLGRSGQTDEAIGFYRAALALRPETSLVHSNLGLALATRGRLDDAIRHFKEAIRLDPMTPVYHNNLGFALYNRGRLDEAIGQHQEAIRLDPKAPVFHNNLGMALAARGRLDDAMSHFKEAIRLDPKAPVYRTNFGSALRDKGRLDEAIGQYQEAIRLDPKASALAHHNLGNVLRVQGRLKDAIGHFQQALQLDPKLTVARRSQGLAHAARQQWDKAAGCYRHVLERDAPDDGHFWFEYAAVLLLSGDRKGYEKACAHMVERYGKAPGLRAYHVARACTLAPGAVAEASLPGRLAETELKAAAGQFWSLTEQGALHYRTDHFQQAAALIEQSLRASAKPGQAVLNWLWLALAQQRLGKTEDARRWLRKAAAWLDQYRDGMPARADQELGLHLHNWLEAHVLRREAENLLR
jgi:serine/threonine-protein kinase